MGLARTPLRFALGLGAVVLAWAWASFGTCVASAAPSASTSAIWVFFRDRGPAAASDSALARAARELSPRALARRAKAARERDGSRGAGAPLVDARDLDPDHAYIRAVTASGAALGSVSRWLNAVSVGADSATQARIADLPFVSGIQPVAHLEDGSASASQEIDPGPAEHQLEMLGVPEAHAMGYRGEGVLVAVLDSGFDLGHEAFDFLNVVAQRDFVYNDNDTSFDPKQDSPGQSSHGTMVLSTIAGYAPGRILGPAWRADYILAKTERVASETRAEEDAWCAAIEWVEALGADLVTSSLSYPSFYKPQDLDGRTAVITRAAEIASERGLLVVNSMGNYGPNERTLSPPADGPDVISVGAVDWNGTLSRFSSIGPTWDSRVKPDLVAMGSGDLVARDLTRDRYALASGTSFSAPLIAGCAAIVMSAHRDWGPEAVRDALVWSADRASRPDIQYGWGVPNVRDAILYPFLEGSISDFNTHEPIPNARVEWEPTGAGAVDSTQVAPSDSPVRGETHADSTGNYVIPNLPSGTYRLHANAPGYFEWVSEPLQVPPSLGDVNAVLRYRGE